MKNGKCTKCGGSRIGKFGNVLDCLTNNPDEVRIINKEFRKLSSVTKKTGFMKSETKAALVEAYVCTECGYFEEYVSNPRDLPWESLPLFEWLSK